MVSASADKERFFSDPIDEALDNGGLLWMVDSEARPELTGGFSLMTLGNPPSFRSWKPWLDSKRESVESMNIGQSARVDCMWRLPKIRRRP